MYSKNKEMKDNITKNLLSKYSVSEITIDKHVLGDVAYASSGNRYFVCLLTRKKGQDIPRMKTYTLRYVNYTNFVKQTDYINSPYYKSE